MPAWCRSPDGHAAKGEIEIESSRQGWHLLCMTSSKGDMTIAQAQRRKFVPHLELTYRNAQKDANAWLLFIKKTTGHFKKWNSVSSAYTQAANQTHNATLSDARLERRAGTGLSPDSRKARGLELSPELEKLLARQVTEHCVCACMMAFIRKLHLYIYVE